jgi:hypothetical protein
VSKALIIAGALVGAALLAKRLMPRMESIDWEARLAAMPDTAPPKWMFLNITAIRANTDRILDLLERDHPQPPATAA